MKGFGTYSDIKLLKKVNESISFIQDYFTIGIKNFQIILC